MKKEWIERANDFLKRMFFWQVIIILMAMELLLIRPVGSILAAIIFVCWLCASKNGEKILALIKQRMTSWRHGEEESSLWFDCEGRSRILLIKDTYCAEGRAGCMLSAEMSLPPHNQWAAIARGLKKQGISSQHDTTTFYISWQPATEEPGSNSDTQDRKIG